jgi:hypothetical protein
MRPPSLPDERTRTAVHEAAHFLIAELYPCPELEVFAISIADSGPFAGGLIADAPSHLDRLSARALVAVLLAGFEAEWMLLGEPAFENAVTDLRQAHHILRRLAGGHSCRIETRWRQIQIRVRRLLERHWDALLLLSAVLERHTILETRDARLALSQRISPRVRYLDGRAVPPPLPRRGPPPPPQRSMTSPRRAPGVPPPLPRRPSESGSRL